MVQIYWKRCRTISFFSILLWFLILATKFYYKKFYARHNQLPQLNGVHNLDKTGNLDRPNDPFAIDNNKMEKQIGDMLKAEKLENHMLPTSTAMYSQSTDVHAFYYAWYGNELVDDKYFHWNHQFLPHWESRISKNFATGKRHTPPDDIGSNFYPVLGAYSSSDSTVIEQHMQYCLMAGIDDLAALVKSKSDPITSPLAFYSVLALSWYPSGKADDEGKAAEKLVPKILTIADQYGIKVCFHIEPYAGRTAASVAEDIGYLIDSYGDHPAFYKTTYRASESRLKPLVYVYDSYRISSDEWSKVFSPGQGIRGTAQDAIVIGLLLDDAVAEIKQGGFDGFYSYFASPSVSYASSMNHWSRLANLAENYNLLFIPSIGPGYIDTNIRPWNAASTKSREDGKYYEDSWRKALSTKPRYVSITSFNEWHEGTQIEPAVSGKETSVDHLLGSFRSGKFKYDDYGENPNKYLDLTKKWVEKFSKS